MIARIAVLALLFANVAAQDSAFIRVTAAGQSESKTIVKEAVSRAVVNIQDACEAGSDVELVAASQASIVVEASVKATAVAGIEGKTTGNGVGAGAAAVSATSTVEVVAKAIAEAISSIASGPKVEAATTAMVQESATAVAAVEQALILGGDSEAVAVAAAEAEVFVAAVATALSAAAGECKDGVPTVGAQVLAGAAPAPAPKPRTTTASLADVKVLGNGFASILSNTALAGVFGSILNSVPAPSTPAPSETPTPSPAYSSGSSGSTTLLSSLGGFGSTNSVQDMLESMLS
eukprot:TRINITY_DN2334_c0_g1_i1.p1 TRINITY_DN2334_c0_g1~~TRINITY_DN2334_c0_g1_i1.p1  ORF type:complete len:291 (+),score=69.59 TRINITY_DN2334_c0_g1_i1:196-1068(+)